MQEISQLVLGIDLSEDITQVSVMRPFSAEPDTVSFDVESEREFLPTVLLRKGAADWKLADHKTRPEVPALHFFHAALHRKNVAFENEEWDAAELLRVYVKLIKERLEKRFADTQIGFIAVTCEEANEEEATKRLLLESFVSQGFEENKLLFMSHVEAFFHYAIRQEESIWRNGAVSFDYGSEGMHYYSMECRISGGKRLLITDYRDYSEEMPVGLPEKEEPERVALMFERLAEKALQSRGSTLFITGRGFEGEWTRDVLRMLSGGRRVFRGQNLYTQGACYAAAEAFYGTKSAEFAVYMPDQIDANVYFLAENANEKEILMAEAGEKYTEVHKELSVILDSVDKLNFRVTPVGTAKDYQIRIVPGQLQLRSDRTSRYAVRVFFTGRDRLVIQIKETGFGDFYPSNNRIYEEIIDLSQFVE